MPNEPCTVKLFVASSGELKEERTRKIELILVRENRRLNRRICSSRW